MEPLISETTIVWATKFGVNMCVIIARWSSNFWFWPHFLPPPINKLKCKNTNCLSHIRLTVCLSYYRSKILQIWHECCCKLCVYQIYFKNLVHLNNLWHNLTTFKNYKDFTRPSQVLAQMPWSCHILPTSIVCECLNIFLISFFSWLCLQQTQSEYSVKLSFSRRHSTSLWQDFCKSGGSAHRLSINL